MDEPEMRIDTQLVELLGQNWLVNELLQAGLEVARPVRDRGVDLIAYADLSSNVTRFVARPIHLKAATKSSFGINRKYERISDLLLTHVWFIGDPTKTVTYCMTYSEAVSVAYEMGYTKTDSWTKKGSYDTTRPSVKLRGLLERYKMTPEKWTGRIIGRRKRARTDSV